MGFKNGILLTHEKYVIFPKIAKFGPEVAPGRYQPTPIQFFTLTTDTQRQLFRTSRFRNSNFLFFRPTLMDRIKVYIGKFSYLGFWASNASSLPKIGQFLIANY